MSLQENDPSPPSLLPDFEREGPRVLQSLCSALTEIVRALNSDGTPKDLTTRLGIDRKLAWKISNLARSPRSDVGRYVPGEQAITVFLAAAQARGVPAELTARAASAAAAFRDLIHRHAGDRTSLDVLLSQSPTSESSEQQGGLDLETRRSAYRANAAIWGIRAQILFRTEILTASAADPDRLDTVSVRGLIGVQRIRSDGNWMIFRVGKIGSAVVTPQGAAEPLDLAGYQATGVPVLADFTSQPLPTLKTAPAPNMQGWIDLLLGPGPVGIAGDSNIVIADCQRATVSRRGVGPEPTGLIGVLIRTPVETIVQDLVVQKGVLGTLDPQAHVFGDLDGSASGPNPERLPISLSVTALGDLPDAARDNPVPRYRSLMRKVLKLANLTHLQFEVFRVRLEYPIVPSAMVTKFPLLTFPKSE